MQTFRTYPVRTSHKENTVMTYTDRDASQDNGGLPASELLSSRQIQHSGRYAIAHITHRTNQSQPSAENQQNSRSDSFLERRHTVMNQHSTAYCVGLRANQPLEPTYSPDFTMKYGITPDTWSLQCLIKRYMSQQSTNQTYETLSAHYCRCASSHRLASL